MTYQRIFKAFLLIIFIAGCNQQKEVADLVISNANIITVNESQPGASAVVVKSGKIIFVGSNEEAGTLIGENTETIDLKGKTMTPGLIEGHGHFLNMGKSELELNLSEVTSYEELVDLVADAVATASPGDWILGRGWHQSKWDSISSPVYNGFQSHQLLSAASPDNPVFLRHASGHAGFANAKAMEIAGIGMLAKESLAPGSFEGGEIVRDELGNPTGIFNETTQALIRKHIPGEDMNTYERAMTLAIENCLENGITSFHDAGVDSFTVALYKKFVAEDKLKIRIYGMLSGSDEKLMDDWLAKGPLIDTVNYNLTLRAIKLYGDGALGSRGAWLLAEYEDRKNHFGHETTPISTISDMVDKGIRAGFQMCTHAIGDRANQEVLNIYEAAFNKHPDLAEDCRFRIEHAQHINAEDIPRFGQLQIIPAMQAIHMASDRPWAIDRLGLQRIEEGAYVWQKLLDTGARIVNGSDVPVEPINPIASFYASVSRKTLKGEPEGGFEPDQRMTRMQALKSYTIDAAYGAFEEKIKGSIEVGKLADFTVYSQDIMTVDESALLNTKIDMTIIGGKVEFIRD